MGLDISFYKNPVYRKDKNFSNDPDLFKPIRYCMQITHNCNNCAGHVLLKHTSPSKELIQTQLTLYDVLWHGEEHEIFQAKQMIPFLEEALPELMNNYKHYHQFDAPNGYGDVFTLIRFCIMMLVECKEKPEAYLFYSR